MESTSKQSQKNETGEENINIDIIRKQEYLLQLKSQVKFPMLEKLKELAKLEDTEEFKHHTKIKIHIDEDNFRLAFIFVFVDKIIIANDSIEKNTKTKSNPHDQKETLINIPFCQFCTFELFVNESDPNEMKINYYTDHTFTTKDDLTFKFLFLKDSYCVHHFIKKYYVIYWQKTFEETILKDYELLIYNKHFVLIKYNRWKKKQERLLLITNKLIFNLGHNLSKDLLDFKVKKVKWADAIRGIKKIVVDAQKGNELKIYEDKIINNADIVLYLKGTKLMKYKETRDFEFYSNIERNEFIAIIRKNYYDICGKYLEVELSKETTPNE